MEVINFDDANYPYRLKNIYDPPKKIYVLGDVNLLNEFGLAIIGCRDCSEYGRKISKSLSCKLSYRGVNIISGLAKGIDSCAHIGCLMGKGKTIAVLGSGFENIYPKENIRLVKEIINNGGAVITEYEPSMRPLSENFPKRNRIISGLSEGVVVIEAKKKSGTMITVEHALEQGKEVFAVPR